MGEFLHLVSLVDDCRLFKVGQPAMVHSDCVPLNKSVHIVEFEKALSYRDMNNYSIVSFFNAFELKL